MPAAGTQGKPGDTGDKGRSIYIGFVNDFFDCDEYDIAPEVRYTKRKVENLRNSHTWTNYKNMYNMVGVDQVYYTGEFIDVPDGTATGGKPNHRKMDLVLYNEHLPGDSLSETYGQDSQPIETYEYIAIKDVSYGLPTGTTMSYTDIYDFDDTTEEDKIFGYSAAPSYVVRFDINHITYDYSDLRRLAEFKLRKGEIPKINEWDFYTTFDEDGKQIENPSEAQYKSWLSDPQLFPLYARDNLGGDYAQYREGVVEYYGIQYMYYDTWNNMQVSYLSWPLDNTKDGKHYMLMPEVEDGMTAYDDMTEAFMYFKQPVLTYPSYQNKEEINQTDYMVDSDGIVYIGIDDNTMYQITPDGRITFRNTNDILMDLRSENDKPLDEQDELLAFDADVYINAIRDYTVTLQSKTPQQLMPTDDRIVWHPGGAKVVKIPRSLSSDIHVGDVIYFYTDEVEFNTSDSENNGKIKYMAVVTEEMVGCDLETLLAKKQLVDPFTYKVIDVTGDATNERAEIKQSTVITATNYIRLSHIDDTVDDDTEGFHNFIMKSMENICTDESKAGLTLLSVNQLKSVADTSINGNFMQFNVADVNQFDGSRKKVTNLQLKSLLPRPISGKSQSMVLSCNEAGFTVDNLGIPVDNHECNYELLDIMYDPNVKFREDGHFICDFMDSGNIQSERILKKIEENNTTQTDYVLHFTFSKSDILKSTTELKHGYTADDYLIGYTVVNATTLNANNELTSAPYLDNVETEDDTCTLTLNPFIFAVPQPNPELIGKDKSDPFRYYKVDQHGNYTIITEPLEDYADNDAVIMEMPFEVRFTVRNKKTGIRYFSNITIVSCWITEHKIGENHINYNITETTVTVQYPNQETSDSPINQNAIFDFDIPSITCEDYTGIVHEPVTLSIAAPENAKGLKIEKILANGMDVYNLQKTLSSSWCTIHRDDKGENPHTRSYTLSINDNIPDISQNSTDKYVTHSVLDYMRTMNSNKTDAATHAVGDAPLFSLLGNKRKYMTTANRSINFVICYTMADPETGETTSYQEAHAVTQPGFKEPRKIPEFKLELANTFEKLSEINSLDNGVMCNQFRTYLDIEIEDFNDMTWGYAGLDDVTIDFTVSSVPYDYKYIASKPNTTEYSRPFIKLATNTQQSIVYELCKASYDTNYEYVRQAHEPEKAACLQFEDSIKAYDPIIANAPRTNIPILANKISEVAVKSLKKDTITGEPSYNYIPQIPKSKYISVTDCGLINKFESIYDDSRKIFRGLPQYHSHNYYAVTCTAIESPVIPEVKSIIHNANNPSQNFDNAIIKLDKDYIILNDMIADMHDRSNYNSIKSGIYHNIDIKFSGIQLTDIINNNHIRVAIDLEFGNPVIAQVFYQFAITEVVIHYKGVDFRLDSQGNTQWLGQKY